MTTQTVEEKVVAFFGRAEKGEFSLRSVMIGMVIFVLLVLVLGYAIDRDTAEQKARTAACQSGNTHMTFDGQ